MGLLVVAAGIVKGDTPPTTPNPPKLAGDWRGSLTLLSGSLPLVFHFTESNGSYSVAIDSPSQGAMGLPGGDVTFDGSNVKALLPSAHGEFDGKFSSDGTSIVGTWSQGSPLPLTLTRQAAKIPSDPIPPLVAGDWSGELKVRGGALHVTFQYVPVGGNIIVSLTCLQDKLVGLVGGILTNHAGSLSVPFDELNAVLSGVLSADDKTISGRWKQGGDDLPITLTHSNPVPPAPLPNSYAGTWSGSLQIPTGSIHIILRFEKAVAGAFTVTFASPDQTGAIYPGILTTEIDGVFMADFTKIGISYVGKMSADGMSLVGNLIQGGHIVPLTLTKSTEAAVSPPRPQNPHPPYPYTVRDVVFRSTDPDVMLAGTITIPRGSKTFPAVLLISGSGGQDRNENVFGHQIFAVLADYLTRRGFVVLRYDKRGIGESTGDLATATTANLADDALGGVGYLMTVKGVDKNRIGLIGHSEGALIAPILAVRDHNIRYLVLLAGSAVPSVALMVRQNEMAAEDAGMAATEVRRLEVLNKTLLTLASHSDGSEKDRATAVAVYVQNLAGTQSRAQLAADAAPSVNILFSPWFRYFLSLDPAEYLCKVTVPVLALNGSKDRQVDPQQNLSAMRAALSRGDRGTSKVVEIPNLNHVFQDCKTGKVSEYATIEETFSPTALKIIGEWLEEVTKP
jgi:uncharacterized protein